ncbi:hypothetical protein C8Q80DRAFT_1120074 [Daedaleopsis nitida]|nr:hypothetical protein C8Q80DRAFT_1120074 [Daedaleopsis nitida]
MVSLTKSYFIAIFCEAILHGMYTILAGGALYLLFKQRSTERSVANVVMIVLTVLMYLMSTVHIALALRVNLIAFFDQHATEGGLTIFDNQGDPLVWVQIGMELLNCLIGDAIVCWRTWILWGRNWRILAFPATCILGGLVAGVGMTQALSRSPDGQELFGEDITIWFTCFGTLTCIANLYSVAAITVKAWQHNRYLRSLNNGAQVAGRNYSVLLVIVESGAVYCIALIITIVLFMLDDNGVYVISDMLNHLTGIYPTIIIVLVCLRITFHDDFNRAKNPKTVRVPSDALSSLHTQSRISQYAVPKPSTDRPLLSFRPHRYGQGDTSASDTRGYSGDSPTGVTFALQPIRIAKRTEQETWYDPAESGNIHQVDRDPELRKHAEAYNAV